MKKVLLSLAVVAMLTVVSCKKADAPAEEVAVDTTAVAVDTTAVDTTATAVDTTAAAPAAEAPAAK
jgi:PBP1b-binding outer membrane lipoprotein LpoB